MVKNTTPALWAKPMTMMQFSTDGSSDEKVTFTIIDEQDVSYTVEAEIGQNMMQAGLQAKVPF